jgi:hypothetical protein
MLLGRGLSVGQITLTEDSYRLWCVVDCDGEAPIKKTPWPNGGCFAIGGRGIANGYPVQLNKCHICLEIA